MQLNEEETIQQKKINQIKMYFEEKKEEPKP
jgi:hypothetical protein